MTDTSGISAEDAVEAIDGEFLVVLGKQFLGEKGFTDAIGADTLVFDTAAEATEAANLLKSKVNADFKVVKYENDAAPEKTPASEPSDTTAATADGTDNGTNECGESENPYLSEADFDENGDFVQNKDSFVDTRGKDGEMITEAGEPIDASAAVQSAFEAFGALPSQLASVVPAIDGALRTINQAIQQSQGNGVVFQALGIDTTQNPASTNDALRPLVAKLNNMRMLIQQTINTLSAQG